MRWLGGLLVALTLQLLPPTEALAQHVGLQPWDAPTGLTAGWTQPTNHGNGASVALSPDGVFLAATSMFRASSEISVIDLRTRSGWRLVPPDWRLDLSEQTFSPDGRRLAFIVNAPHNQGVTEIWIVPCAGGAVLQRIGAPGRAYRYPTFSPDGRRIAYFRDAAVQRQNLPRIQILAGLRTFRVRFVHQS